MPVLVEPSDTAAALLGLLPHGSQHVSAFTTAERWLSQHRDEYAVLLGPGFPADEVAAACVRLRAHHPTVGVVLVRERIDTVTLTAAMRAGVREVVEAADETDVRGAIERARDLHTALRGPTGVRRTGSVLTVFSPKGGVGKTTVAVNLAAALADRGARRVCLVDLDLAFGDVAITLQLFPEHTIEEAVGGGDRVDAEALEALLTPHDAPLMVLAAPSRPDVRERVPPGLVRGVLAALRESFDVVVVDTAPAFDDTTLTALEETDECVIVTTLDVPTIKNVRLALDTMDTLAIAVDHRHLLLNRADESVGIDQARVESILAMPVLALVATSTEVTASTNLGEPVVLARPEHPASRALRSVASALVGATSDGVSAAPDEPAGRSTRAPRLLRRRPARR